MAEPGKVIVACAITGSIHVPSQTPHLPQTPEQIAAEAIAAADAGAAIVHLHARDPRSGQPNGDPAMFARFLPTIAARSNVIINITTGGGHGMPLEERTRAARTFQPELCSLNMGSMNSGLFPLKDRIEHFQHPWEHEYLEMTRDFIFRNTCSEIQANGYDVASKWTTDGTNVQLDTQQKVAHARRACPRGAEAPHDSVSASCLLESTPPQRFPGEARRG